MFDQLLFMKPEDVNNCLIGKSCWQNFQEQWKLLFVAFLLQNKCFSNPICSHALLLILMHFAQFTWINPCFECVYVWEIELKVVHISSLIQWKQPFKVNQSTHKLVIYSQYLRLKEYYVSLCFIVRKQCLYTSWARHQIKVWKFAWRHLSDKWTDSLYGSIFSRHDSMMRPPKGDLMHSMLKNIYCEASPESACVRSGVLLFGVSWPFVKSTVKNILNEKIS